MDHEALLQIGVFSRLARLSVRMLRHYDKHGLLIPAEVDPESGYRYYRATQLATAEQIVRLRDAGFTVADMAELLPGFGDPSIMSAALAGHRAQLLHQQGLLTERLATLDRLIDEFQEAPMTIDVETITLPAMTVAALRDVIGSYADEHLLWQRLMPPLMSADHQPFGLAGATFYDEDYQDTDVDVEVWVQLPHSVAVEAPLTCRRVDEQQVLMATLEGSYDGMSAVTAALGAQVAARGLRVGPMFNIYRVGPAQDPNPQAWITDVCLPIQA